MKMDHFRCLVVVVALSFHHCAATSEGSSTESENDARNLRERRDGYGGSSYSGGGGYGGGGYGSYGCHCPYQQCDSGSDMLLYFAAGALLGLLFSMLTAPAMMMAAPAPAPAGRKSSAAKEFQPKEAGTNLSNVARMLSEDVAPLAMELMNVYSMSQKEPLCGRRWLCEVTQRAMKKGGLKSRLSSFASVTVSWMMQDMMPFLENLTGDGDDLDCSIFAPKCRPFFTEDAQQKPNKT